MIGSNPALNEDTFSIPVDELDNRNIMTMQGTAFRALTLVGVCVVAASITWGMAFKHGFGAAMPWAIGGGLAAFVIALITCFKPQLSPVTGLLYAVTKGLFLGAISAFYEASFGTGSNGQATIYSGIVFQAVSLTFGVLVVMLTLYGTRIIRVTNKLRVAVCAAAGAIFLAYLANFVMGFFGASMPYLHSSGPIGIGISLAIIGVASFMLLLDFDMIENGVKSGAPKYMEWYGGFALLVTLAWLYLEILRLLAKLRSAD